MLLAPTMVEMATSPIGCGRGAPAHGVPPLESEREPSILQLNVGGHVFSTTKDTLLAAGDSFFSVLLGGEFGVHRDAQGLPFIDRDPKLFRYLLNFCRSQCTSLPIEHEGRAKLVALLGEAEFFQVAPLIDAVQAKIAQLDRAEALAASRQAVSRGRSRPRNTSRGPSAPGRAANRPPVDGPEGSGEGSPVRTPVGEEQDSDMSGSEDEDGERRTPLSQGSYVEAEHADLISQAALNMDVDF